MNSKPQDHAAETELDGDQIRDRYSQLTDIWQEADRWHWYTYRYMQNYIERAAAKMAAGPGIKLLNVGSAGNEYHIQAEHYHVDIVFDKIASFPRAYEASAEALPFGDAMFDGCLCAGSVVDYCDARKALSEFGRVVRGGGFLIFDFEQTRTLQLLGKKDYGCDFCVVDTFYCGETERVRIYSPEYIRGLLDEVGFEVLDQGFYHILSPLAYRIFHDENRAAGFAGLDPVARHIPFLGKNSCNVMLTCRKIGA
ncbi:MAG: class I SAM-dependent methyltransferase [Peptococcaceae bacterium]|nr:class I SAM-dependent methyltransferase [Peptococcaceae bacterium]